MNTIKKITRFSIIALIIVIVGVVFLLKFAFNVLSGFIQDGFGPSNPIISVTPDGVNIVDYIKINDGGIEIGGSRVDFAKIGEKVSDGLEASGIEVSNNMSGSLNGVDITEAGFQQNRYSFSAELNRSLDIQVKNCDVIIASGDSDSITVDMFESDEFTYRLSTVDNTLTIRDGVKESAQKVIDIFGFKIPIGSTENSKTYTGLAMIIYLPENFEGEIKLNTTNGDIKLGNLSLGESIKAATTSGSIELSNIDAYEVSISTSNGRITLDDISADEIAASTTMGRVSLNNLIAKRFDVSTTNASIDFTRLFGEKFTFKSSDGDISGSILGQESLFSITTETDQSAYPKSAENERAQYKLSASTSGGDINIRFVE